MNTFLVEALGVNCALHLVNFDGNLPEKSIEDFSSGIKPELDIYFFKGQEGFIPRDLLKKLRRPFFEIFDLNKKKIFCFHEGDVPLDFMVRYEISQSFLIFQNELDLVFLHSDSVLSGGRVYLFVAPSGGGKSTIASYLERTEGFEVICDESSVLRKLDGKYYAQRYPVGFKEKESASRKHKIAGIYFLEKASDDSLVKISSLEAIKRALLA